MPYERENKENRSNNDNQTKIRREIRKWTKSRGRVELGEVGGFSWAGVEGRGEKAHNCN